MQDFCRESKKQEDEETRQSKKGRVQVSNADKMIEIPGGGFVRLDAAMADDSSVVNSARVSFAKNKVESAEVSDVDKGLINFLMRERHGTPFEHNAFRFHIKTPVFVAREWFRHRIGSFNEFSARYSEVPNEFFVPEKEDVRTQVGKPGAYTFDPIGDPLASTALLMIENTNEAAYRTYQSLLEMGVAKEQARVVLPVSMFTQFYWTVNARALMNFLSLRTHETAQRDIRQYADAVLKLAAPEMPITFAAWEKHDRQVP
jgi:thymidylate synthase (FAD)